MEGRFCVTICKKKVAKLSYFLHYDQVFVLPREFKIN